MKLIADSGSTKTDWVLVEQEKVLGKYQTQGINPFHQDDATITTILQDELLPNLISFNFQFSTLHFYGSGLCEEQKPRMNALFKKVFPSETIFLENDLLGAARALCGREEGIACILGTGANSCLYDGEKIVQNTSPLGYILGDEGSGAVLGKLFMNAIFKNPAFFALQTLYLQEIGLTMPLIINKVYREPLANRFLASTSSFIRQHLDFEPLRQLVIDNFRSFIRHNVVQYQRAELPVHAVGSIAWYYQDELAVAVKEEGFQLGQLLKTPIDGLVKYHQSFM